MLFEQPTEIQTIVNTAKTCYLANVVKCVCEKITPFINNKRRVILLRRNAHDFFEYFNKIAFTEITKAGKLIVCKLNITTRIHYRKRR